MNNKERQKIKSHVIHSYEFLKNILWTKELENILDIAHAHHEKALDIIGYEAKGSLIDSDLFDMFVKGKVYEIVHEKR